MHILNKKRTDNTKNDSTLEHAFQEKKSGTERVQVSKGESTVGLGKRESYLTSTIRHVLQPMCMVFLNVRTPPSIVNSSKKNERKLLLFFVQPLLKG